MINGKLECVNVVSLLFFGLTMCASGVVTKPGFRVQNLKKQAH